MTAILIRSIYGLYFVKFYIHPPSFLLKFFEKTLQLMTGRALKISGRRGGQEGVAVSLGVKKGGSLPTTSEYLFEMVSNRVGIIR